VASRRVGREFLDVRNLFKDKGSLDLILEVIEPLVREHTTFANLPFPPLAVYGARMASLEAA